jgi:membrane-bound serine protease (ClpP class)
MAQRLMQAAPTTGAESLLGLDAEVLEWSGPRSGVPAAAGSGVVRVDGVRWNATGPAHLANGESVRITNVDQLTVTVEPATAATQAGERNT